MASPPSKDKKEKGDGSGNKTPPRSRSPRRRSRRGDCSRSHTRDARRPREVVVERIIREGSSSGNWPQLTRTNYHE